MDLSSGERLFSSRPSSHLESYGCCSWVLWPQSGPVRAHWWPKTHLAGYRAERLQVRLWANKNPGYIIGLLDPCKEFLFSVAVLHKEVRGQGQLQSSSHGAGFSVLLKDATAGWMLGNTYADAAAGQPGGRTLQGNSSSSTDSRIFYQQELHCSLTKDIFSFITLHLICYCIWFCSFPPNCLLSPVLCHLCYCWICTTKLNQKREEDIWIYIYIDI